MTLKFRIIERTATSDFLVQTKSFFGWSYKTQTYDISMTKRPSVYVTEAHCIARVLSDCKIKRERITLVQYSSLKIL